VCEAGEWDAQVDNSTCRTSAEDNVSFQADGSRLPAIGVTVVRLEVLNASWPQQWLRPHVTWLQQASVAVRGRAELAEIQQRGNITAAHSLGAMLLPRLSDIAVWVYDVAFPTPRYEVTFGSHSAEWMEVQSPKVREALGVRLVNLQVSARDPMYFGPQWTRELLSLLRLYDLYVLHSLPLHFTRFGLLPNGNSSGPTISASPKLFASIVGSEPISMNLALSTHFAAKSVGSGFPWAYWLAVRFVCACGTLFFWPDHRAPPQRIHPKVYCADSSDAGLFFAHYQADATICFHCRATSQAESLLFWRAP
jgi:hypothetical protein